MPKGIKYPKTKKEKEKTIRKTCQKKGEKHNPSKKKY